MESEVVNKKNALETEFWSMEKDYLWPAVYLEIRQESMKKEHSVDEAKKLDNKLLNRYRDVKPYDHSRVILSKTDYNYINASYVPVEEARRSYILTQGPLSTTIPHFWLMVWDENSKAIIMLNKLIEKNQSKCYQYWPYSSGALELPEVELRVELLRKNKLSHYIVREIRLTNTSTNESREIIQFHYTTWPDFGVPQSPLAILKFLRDIRQSEAFGLQYGPPIVHCSAGIGRSGTFCLVDSCLVLMEEKGVENVKVKDVLLEMRNHRMGLIQTPEQLRFSYIAIIQGLKVDWGAKDNDGLPEDDVSYFSYRLKNGETLGCGKLGSDSDDEPPPLPPPRSAWSRFPIGKPLPPRPRDSSSDSDELLANDKYTEAYNRAMSHIKASIVEGDDKRTEDMRIQRLLYAGISDAYKYKKPRVFKPVLGWRGNDHLADKVQEMKRKLAEAEKWHKIKSACWNVAQGASVVFVAGCAVAYFWYRKSG